ncbi:hypothetical protein [Pseudomonas sp. xss_2]|uniref:hypothetical protein n=1 Tax=Pseudomonas sp. xss_2 TaxID=3367215 RepID=UPI00370ADEEE
MIVATGKTGPVFEYDESRHFGRIKYRHNGEWVYLPPEEADGKYLKNGDVVIFDIIIDVESEQPHATNVRRT